MNVAYRRTWTQEDFLAWVVHQEERYEFDGVRPVRMNGGTVNHAQIMSNLHDALRSRLRGGQFRVFGPSAGMETVDRALRYPDALVFSGPVAGTSQKIPNVIATFEVQSPSTAREDRTTKLREYSAVSTIRHYALIETQHVGVISHARADATAPWQRTPLLRLADQLDLPAIGVSIGLAELYADVEFEPSKQA